MRLPPAGRRRPSKSPIYPQIQSDPSAAGHWTDRTPRPGTQAAHRQAGSPSHARISTKAFSSSLRPIWRRLRSDRYWRRRRCRGQRVCRRYPPPPNGYGRAKRPAPRPRSEVSPYWTRYRYPHDRRIRKMSHPHSWQYSHCRGQPWARRRRERKSRCLRPAPLCLGVRYGCVFCPSRSSPWICGCTGPK